MATRNTAGLPGRTERGTEFQLHVQAGPKKKLVDFTEQKLLRYAAKTKDVQQKLTLLAMVDDYRGGLIAISWRNGLPVYFRVTKDA